MRISPPAALSACCSHVMASLWTTWALQITAVSRLLYYQPVALSSTLALLLPVDNYIMLISQIHTHSPVPMLTGLAEG